MNTRERIVEAAGKVMQHEGLARATTRIIAREAGVSEGTIYNHFDSKEHLFLAVLTEQVAPFAVMMMQLQHRAGREELDAVLLDVARSGLDFYAESYFMSASIFAEPQLLARQREEMRSRGAGPHKAIDILEAYLSAEQRLGNIRADADVRATATMLIGACHQRAFLAAFWDTQDAPEEKDAMASGIVEVILRGLLTQSST